MFFTKCSYWSNFSLAEKHCFMQFKSSWIVSDTELRIICISVMVNTMVQDEQEHDYLKKQKKQERAQNWALMNSIKIINRGTGGSKIKPNPGSNKVQEDGTTVWNAALKSNLNPNLKSQAMSIMSSLSAFKSRSFKTLRRSHSVLCWVLNLTEKCSKVGAGHKNGLTGLKQLSLSPFS